MYDYLHNLTFGVSEFSFFDNLEYHITLDLSAHTKLTFLRG